VPQRWAEDPRLGKWVNTQRKFKKKLDRGEPSLGMTAARAAKLESMGFDTNRGHYEAQWEARRSWEEQLERLAAYKAAHGDCNVPHDWAEDPLLGRWVSTQRRLKRKLRGGEPSAGMTVEWAARLTALGLVWDQHNAEWETQLARLTAYKAAHGDCNVPRDWAEDPQLASWVDMQRRFRRQLESSEASQRVRAEWAQLTSLGFVFEVRLGLVSSSKFVPRYR
jgi:hypothetical protein